MGLIQVIGSGAGPSSSCFGGVPSFAPGRLGCETARAGLAVEFDADCCAGREAGPGSLGERAAPTPETGGEPRAVEGGGGLLSGASLVPRSSARVLVDAGGAELLAAGGRVAGSAGPDA